MSNLFLHYFFQNAIERLFWPFNCILLFFFQSEREREREREREMFHVSPIDYFVALNCKMLTLNKIIQGERLFSFLPQQLLYCFKLYSINVLMKIKESSYFFCETETQKYLSSTGMTMVCRRGI